jgi:dsRNA-specific ribonuclease
MNENNSFVTGIFFGDRGINFKSMIYKLLKSCDIEEKYIKILTKEEYLHIYSMAFTSELVDDKYNYQFFEQLGDSSFNKFIIKYIYNRFPQLQCNEGVKVAARLKINYGSKSNLSSIAEKLDFWNFITAPNELRHRMKKSLLEDVFESFLGSTEYILDYELGICVGFACVYKILQSIFDKIHISLNYEDLYDAKTRLKELFDCKMYNLGILEYEETKNNLLTSSTVFYNKDIKYDVTKDGKINTKKIINSGKRVKIGEGTASLKYDAQQVASKNALENLNKQGISKPVAKIYSKFNSGNTQEKTTEKDILNICNGKENINNSIYTKKSKIEYKYTCSVLSLKCRERDYLGIKHCINLGADPNIKDIHGMTCIDNLLIGRYNQKLIDKVFEKFFNKGITMNINSRVYEVYCADYDISKYIEKINIV